MKIVSLRSNPLKVAFAGALLSATLINAGDVKANPCLLNNVSNPILCPSFSVGDYTISNLAINPPSGLNVPPSFLVDFLNATVSGNTLSVDVSISPGRSIPGATLTYNVSKIGAPMLQASADSTVGGVPPINTGATNVTSTISGLSGGSLASLNGGTASALFTVPAASTSVSTTFSTTGSGNLNSFKVQFTSGSPAPSPVPGPLPLLGAGAAFGISRRLRRRINTSATA